MEMKRYVLGFFFDKDDRVLLIHKAKEGSIQKGFYNGIGGKVEKEESIESAMLREFEEETGEYMLHDVSLVYKIEYLQANAVVYVFTSVACLRKYIFKDDYVYETTEGTVSLCSPEELLKLQTEKTLWPYVMMGIELCKQHRKKRLINFPTLVFDDL